MPRWACSHSGCGTTNGARLTMARDRVGEKPLAYYWDGAVLAFASELKALRPLHEAHLDPASVDAYLALGYVPAPLGIFRHTRKLPAGHLIELHAGHLAERRWWFPERVALAAPITEDRHQTTAYADERCGAATSPVRCSGSPVPQRRCGLLCDRG